MLAVGQKIDPSLTLRVVRQGQEQTLPLAELLTRRTIVSIYMRNNTGSCDKQNASLAQSAAALDQAGYNLIAVSRDTCNSHRKYAEKMSISYFLASDPDDRFAHAVEAMVEKSMYGKKYQGPARAAFVLDTDGTLLAVIEKVDSARHGDELLELLQQLA